MRSLYYLTGGPNPRRFLELRFLYCWGSLINIFSPSCIAYNNHCFKDPPTPAYRGASSRLPTMSRDLWESHTRAAPASDQDLVVSTFTQLVGGCSSQRGNEMPVSSVHSCLPQVKRVKDACKKVKARSVLPLELCPGERGDQGGWAVKGSCHSTDFHPRTKWRAGGPAPWLPPWHSWGKMAAATGTQQLASTEEGMAGSEQTSGRGWGMRGIQTKTARV